METIVKKRLKHAGSLAALTVSLSLVFHLIGMSFPRWKKDTCLTCGSNDRLAQWFTSLNQRCYSASVSSIYNINASNMDSPNEIFSTTICIPNKYLFVKDPNQAMYCYEAARRQADTICSIGGYDEKYCKCEYTYATKTVIAAAVLAALSLGLLMILSHFLAFVKLDRVLRWLIPVSMSLLILSMLFIAIVLGVSNSRLNEDVSELRFSWSLFKSVTQNDTIIEQAKEELVAYMKENYSSKVGWSYGMEVLSLYFALLSLAIYAIMFYARHQPKKPAINH